LNSLELEGVTTILKFLRFLINQKSNATLLDNGNFHSSLFEVFIKTRECNGNQAEILSELFQTIARLASSEAEGNFL
jgi:hypothetical protein